MKARSGMLVLLCVCGCTQGTCAETLTETWTSNTVIGTVTGTLASGDLVSFIVDPAVLEGAEHYVAAVLQEPYSAVEAQLAAITQNANEFEITFTVTTVADGSSTLTVDRARHLLGNALASPDREVANLNAKLSTGDYGDYTVGSITYMGVEAATVIVPCGPACQGESTTTTSGFVIQVINTTGKEVTEEEFRVAMAKEDPEVSLAFGVVAIGTVQLILALAASM